jgi:hypothetical protein
LECVKRAGRDTTPEQRYWAGPKLTIQFYTWGTGRLWFSLPRPLDSLEFLAQG